MSEAETIYALAGRRLYKVVFNSQINRLYYIYNFDAFKN